MTDLDFTPKLQQEIENGNAFITAYKQVSPGIGNKFYIQIKVGAVKYFAFNIRVFTDVKFLYKLTEATVSFPGTELTPTNMNGNSTTLPTHQVFFNTSIYTPTKLILPGVSEPATSGVPTGNLFITEFIGKLNTSYVLEMTNDEGGGNFGVSIIGYEGV